MDKNTINELLINISEAIGLLETEQLEEGYCKTANSIPDIQKFLMLLLEFGILEEEIVMAVLTDLVEAMEQQDVVLIIDVLNYGIRTLIQDILKIMEEEDE